MHTGQGLAVAALVIGYLIVIGWVLGFIFIGGLLAAFIGAAS